MNRFGIPCLVKDARHGAPGRLFIAIGAGLELVGSELGRRGEIVCGGVGHHNGLMAVRFMLRG